MAQRHHLPPWERQIAKGGSTECSNGSRKARVAASRGDASCEKESGGGRARGPETRRREDKRESRHDPRGRGKVLCAGHQVPGEAMCWFDAARRWFAACWNECVVVRCEPAAMWKVLRREHCG